MPFQLKYFGVSLLALLVCSQNFGIISFSINAQITDEGDPCQDPAEACVEWGPGTFVYDPSDCHQYYSCHLNITVNAVPSDEPVKCEEDLTFDFASQNCSSRISSCDKACVNKGCLYECVDGHDGLVADPNDCNIFYICVGGGLSSASSCLDYFPGSYFDGDDCTDKDYLCCDACTAYCTSNDTGKNIPDPYDCTAYYTCENVGFIPSEGAHSFCEDGEYFDSDSGMCVEETESCKNICDSPITATQAKTTETNKKTTPNQDTTPNKPSTANPVTTAPAQTTTFQQSTNFLTNTPLPTNPGP